MSRYGDHTVTSPNALKRWSHQSRFNAVAKLMDASPGDRILDFGTGDGFFLDLLRRQQPRAEYFGFEPRYLIEAAKALHLEGVTLESDFDRLPLGHFNKIACLEVLEHLPPQYLQVAIDRIVAGAAPGAQIVISVPIENGLPSLVKNIVRSFSPSKIHRDIGAKNMWLAFAGRCDEIQRPGSDRPYITTHVGFDWRGLKEQLLRTEGLSYLATRFSPLAPMGAACNSQVIMTFTRSTGAN